MKRILIAGAFALAAAGQALAADLPEPMPPPPPRAPAMYVPTVAPPYNWGGFYVGINGGGGFGNSNWTGAGAGAATTGSFTTDGFLVGGTLGANYQIGALVFGVEADLDWTNYSGTSTNAGCTGLGVASCETSSNYLGTARGRIGYAFDCLLLYATAGGAFANVRGTTNFGNTTTNEFGWTAGAGLEYALTPSWTAKAEYLFVDFSNGSCSIAGCAVNAATTISLYENLVRVGVNYKFSF